MRLINLRFQGGQENKGNQMYQAAIVSQSVYQLNHTRRQVLLNQKQLAAILGRPENDQNLILQGELGAKMPEQSEETFHKLAVLHPSHVQAYYQMVAADANIEIVDGNWLPNLNLTGFVGQSGPDFPPNTGALVGGGRDHVSFFPRDVEYL